MTRNILDILGLMYKCLKIEEIYQNYQICRNSCSEFTLKYKIDKRKEKKPRFKKVKWLYVKKASQNTRNSWFVLK